jgi:small subunit ribosomal protein S20
VANIKSAEKRNKQNEKRRQRNVQVKSSVRTAAKKIIKSLSMKDSKPEEIEKMQKDFVKTIDTAAQKGIVTKNAASRKKSRIAKKINALKAQTAQQ